MILFQMAGVTWSHRTHQEMKAQCQSSDRISALSQDTIEKVLTFMSLRDAVRTSILSRKWRYCWTSMPKLVFDDNLVNVSSDIIEIKKYKLVNAIFRVLLLHKGPISELNIRVGDIDVSNEIDLIILHLSRSNNTKKFIFEICADNVLCYKLPCAFFSLQGLEHLDLTFCAFEVPLVFNGFSMLKSVIFYDVEITFEMLQRFLSSSPLLKYFILVGTQKKDFTGGKNCTFVELLKCLPLVEYLEMSWFYTKHLAAGGMPQKLSTLLVNLRVLIFDVCFLSQDEVLSAFCVINNSPNLEKLKIGMIHGDGDNPNNLFDLQDYADFNLDHLKELEIQNFRNYAPEMEFVKLIMAKSPVLKKAQIELCNCTSVSAGEEVNMLRDLLRSPSVRASPANFIIERREKQPVNAN